MKHFQKILEFQKLLKKFNCIYRDLGSLRCDNDKDNDVEHSYRVAMLCWMVIDEYKLKLDINKVVKYSLIHDLVEVHAGDISMYVNYDQKDKEKREHKSFLKLKKDYPKLKTIWQSIADYEKREDEESKFVYVIEKLEPVLTVVLSEEDHWLKNKVPLDDFIIKKTKKTGSIDSFAQNFVAEMTKYLRKNKKKYFIS